MPDATGAASAAADRRRDPDRDRRPRAAPRRSPLRAVLLAVIAVGLLCWAAGWPWSLGLGRRRRRPARTRSTPASPGTCPPTTCRAWRWPTWWPTAATTRPSAALAFDIATTQTNQVGRMQGWLALWGLPPTGGDADGVDGRTTWPACTWRGGSGLMPGMATEDELAEPARRCPGTAFDVEFLRLMIRHHQGGLPMAQYAAAHARDRRRAHAGAKSIADTQTAETRR